MSGTHFELPHSEIANLNGLDENDEERDSRRASDPVNSPFTRRFTMRILKPTILAVALTVMLCSTASAGNIGGMRTSGNIGGMRSAGNIGGTRSAGIIPPTAAPVSNRGTSRVDFETAVSDTFVGLIRMLLESGALL